MNTPWSLTFSEIGCGIIRDSTGEDICLVLQSGQQQTEPRMKEANLIVAAPDLYEALRKAEQLASIASDWNLEEVEIDGQMTSTSDLSKEFFAALAKAVPR